MMGIIIGMLCSAITCAWLACAVALVLLHNWVFLIIWCAMAVPLAVGIAMAMLLAFLCGDSYD